MRYDFITESGRTVTQNTTDVRYEWVTCANCGRAWNRIDFGCEMHGYFCNNPVPLPEEQPAIAPRAKISIVNDVFFGLLAVALLWLWVFWLWVCRR